MARSEFEEWVMKPGRMRNTKKGLAREAWEEAMRRCAVSTLKLIDHMHAKGYAPPVAKEDSE